MALRITIIGTGAIGTALGMALRASGQEMTVVGHDKELTHANEARQRGAIDKIEWNLLNSVAGADLVLLALPLSAIAETLRLIGPELRADAVVSDTAALKAPVQRWAAQHLPPTVHFVGGNPLVQTRGSGPTAATADLFAGKRYSLTPLASTAEAAISLVSGIVSLLGAEPLYLEPVEHDGLISAVTQLPLLTSLALLSATTSHPGWREMSEMAGATYGDATRLGVISAPELTALLSENRENLLRWADALRTDLDVLTGLLRAGHDAELEERLVTLLVARARWAEEGEPDPLTTALDEAKTSPLSNLFGLRSLRRKKRDS